MTSASFIVMVVLVGMHGAEVIDGTWSSANRQFRESSIPAELSVIFMSQGTEGPACSHGQATGSARIDEGSIRAAASQDGWSRGRWLRGVSVANVLGTCFTTWHCRPGGQILYDPDDSQLLFTESKRTPGACAVTRDDPESCGVCVSIEPAAQCEYCVQPKQCANSSLGSRTREALGCCPVR